MLAVLAAAGASVLGWHLASADGRVCYRPVNNGGFYAFTSPLVAEPKHGAFQAGSKSRYVKTQRIMSTGGDGNSAPHTRSSTRAKAEVSTCPSTFDSRSSLRRVADWAGERVAEWWKDDRSLAVA